MIQRTAGRDLLLGLWLLPILLIGACSSNEPKTVVSEDPGLKIPAMKAAADTKDLSQVKQLVKDLESDDPAVRFYSIGALDRLTGQTFGYQYYMEDDRRAAAIEKWKAWLSGWEAGQHDLPGKK